MMLFTLIVLATLAYFLVGVVCAVFVYVIERGGIDEDRVTFYVLCWPLLILGGMLFMLARGAQAIGDWIIKKKEA
jgi:hypothetical protein